MRGVEAVIQPFVLDKVLGALEAVTGLTGVTLFQVKGWDSRQPPGPEETDGYGFAQKTILKIVVPDEAVDRVVDTHPGERHDGAGRGWEGVRLGSARGGEDPHGRARGGRPVMGASGRRPGGSPDREAQTGAPPDACVTPWPRGASVPVARGSRWS